MEIQKKRKYKNYLIIVGLLLFLSILSFLPLMYKTEKKYKVAIYELKGIITKENKAEAIVMDRVINDLESLSKKYDGIIIKIDSPGGDAYATKKISEKIEEIKKKKPIISCVDSIATSGAYWIISQTDYIIADEFSLIGSIGVLLIRFDITELMDKIGVKYDFLGWGELKDMGTPFRNMTEEERELFRNKSKIIYEYFIRAVSKGRNLSYNKTKKLATGEIFLGVEAFDKNLIDELGNLEDCKKKMAKILNTSEENINFNFIKGYEKQEFNLFGVSIGYGAIKALLEYLNNQNIQVIK